MNRGWVLASDIRKADSDEENMREAGWVEVVVVDELDKLCLLFAHAAKALDELVKPSAELQHKSDTGDKC